MLGIPDRSRGCLFDLDGVLTQTAKVHAAAWQEMFDDFLRQRAESSGQPFVPFDPVADYDKYVDGKPREDGTRSFLQARGINLPEGSDSDPPGTPTIAGLSSQKNQIVLRRIEAGGVQVYPGSVRYLRAVGEAGLLRAVVTSSANSASVLAAAGLSDQFDVVVDGVVARKEGLAGKPAPDSYLAAARKLGPRARRGGRLRGRAGRGGRRAGRAVRLRGRRGPGRAGRRAARGRGQHRGAGPGRTAGPAVIQHPAFPVEPWCLRESTLHPDMLAQTESLFALSNGHIGWRGNLDEGEPHGLPGSYLNGMYERRPLPYAEAGFGFPESGETVINVTNGKLIRLLVDDEPFDIRYGELLHHERVLDFRSGTLTRRADWVSPAGRRVRVSSVRLVSLTQRSIGAISYQVESLDGPVRVVVQSELVANEELPPPGGILVSRRCWRLR